MGEAGIYTLALEGSNYYVGRAKYNIHKRIAEHFRGNGAKWTQEHEPIYILDLIELEDMNLGITSGCWKLDKFERYRTKEMMLRHGWESVRGGGWVRVDMKKAPSFIRNS